MFTYTFAIEYDNKKTHLWVINLIVYGLIVTVECCIFQLIFIVIIDLCQKGAVFGNNNTSMYAGQLGNTELQ